MRLYYFTPAEFALENIFHKRLKISLIHSLNDPFELLPINSSDPNLYNFVS